MAEVEKNAAHKFKALVAKPQASRAPQGSLTHLFHTLFLHIASDLLREEWDVAKGREKTAGFNGGGRSYVDCTDDSTEDCVEVNDLSHIAILSLGFDKICLK